MGIENGRKGKIGIEPNEVERSMHQLFVHELGEMAAGQRTEFSAITTNGLFLVKYRCWQKLLVLLNQIPMILKN